MGKCIQGTKKGLKWVAPQIMPGLQSYAMNMSVAVGQATASLALDPKVNLDIVAEMLKVEHKRLAREANVESELRTSVARLLAQWGYVMSDKVGAAADDFMDETTDLEAFVKDPD